jgi:hypothetical protein
MQPSRCAQLPRRRRSNGSGTCPTQQKTVVSKHTALAYVAPVKRRTSNARRKRKNLADLMMDRAMEPALEENETRVRETLEDVLDRLGRKEGF